MKLNEIAVEYHDSLNPKLWKNNTLLPEVRAALINIAKEFIEYLDINNSFIEDVILTGSNCNYNWTKNSDIDLHIVVNYQKFQNACQAMNIEDAFSAKKSLWNNEHDIKIYDIPVELYVQNDEQESSKDGVTYSLAKNIWYVEPNKVDTSSVDERLVNQKYNNIKDEIMNIINNKIDNKEIIDRLKDKISRFRRTGLAKNGEFSIENLAYKKLRKEGYMDKLYDYSSRMESKSLSLK